VARRFSQAMGRASAGEVSAEQLQELTDEAAAALPSFTADHVSIVLLSLAHLAHDPGEEFVRRACTEVIQPRVADFGGREVMTTLWAFQRLGHRPTAAGLEALCEQMERQMDGYNAQELVTTLWCLNKLDHHPGESVLGAYAAEIEGRLGQLTTKQLSMGVWGLATARYVPRASFLVRMEAEVLDKLGSFEPEPLAGTLHAMAEFNYEPCEQLFELTELHLMETSHLFSSTEMSMAVSALVSMGHEPNALLAHLERELSMPNTKSDPFAAMPPLELLEQAQVLAGREGQDPHQVDLLLHHLQMNLGVLDAKSMAAALVAIAEGLGARKEQILLPQVLEAVHGKLPDVDALDLYHVMLVLAALCTRAAQPPSHPFMLDLSAHLSVQLSALPPSELASIVTAYGLLVRASLFPPGERLRASLEAAVHRFTYGEQEEKFTFGELREVSETLQFVTLMQSEDFRAQLQQQQQQYGAAPSL